MTFYAGCSDGKDNSVHMGITEYVSQFPPDTAPTFQFSTAVNIVKGLTCESSSRRDFL